MKKIYTLTLITMMFFTSSLFSQTLPYNVGVGGSDGGISTSNGWNFSYKINWQPSTVNEQPDGSIQFANGYSSYYFQGEAVKEITNMGSFSNLNYKISWSTWNGNSPLFEFLGSTDGLNWTVINNNVSNSSQLSFSNSNYTWVRIVFSGTGIHVTTLTNFDLSDMSTGIELSNVSNNYTDTERKYKNN